mgnify:FL=1
MEGERREVEIDLIALNEKTRQIAFIECKWKDGVSAEKILNGLKEKASAVNWHNNERQEYYCVFAKTFSNKRPEEKNLLLYDLNDLTQKKLGK